MLLYVCAFVLCFLLCFGVGEGELDKIFFSVSLLVLFGACQQAPVTRAAAVSFAAEHGCDGPP